MAAVRRFLLAIASVGPRTGAELASIAVRETRCVQVRGQGKGLEHAFISLFNA